MLLVTGATYLIFEAFQILFSTASLIFTAAKSFHQVISERTKHKASSTLHPIMAVVLRTLNLLHVSSCCEMFTVCDVLQETRQNKNANKLSGVRSTDWKSSLRMLYLKSIPTIAYFLFHIQLEF